MHRIFVAIRPPREVRERLLGLMGGVRDARWQADDQLHVTVRFIGEVESHHLDDIAIALGTVYHPRFEIALSGIGTFGRRGQPQLLWAGVTPPEPLKALHKKVDQACVRAGLEPERRAYHPHITLARLKKATAVDGFLTNTGTLSSAPFAVDRFGLYESHLTPERAHYSLLADYSLA